MFDLNDVRLFTKAVEFGSLSSAAKTLGVPKSTASRSLARLEDQLGAALLQRSPRRLSLTEAGRQFYSDAIRILGEVDEAVDAVSRLRAGPRGLLRVSTTVTVGQALLAPLLPAFLERYPEMRIAIELTTRPVDLIGDQVDLVIQVGPLEDSALRARRLGHTDVWLCASPSYLARHGRPEKVADLARHDVLDWPWPDAPHEWTLLGAGGEESVRVTPRLTANDGSVLRHAVLAGTGIAWLAPFLCMEDVRAGRLVRLLPDWRRDPFEIHAVFPAQREISPKLRAFVDFLVERLRIPDPGDGVLRLRAQSGG